LEGTVKIFFAALSQADGVNNAWCREKALNDTLVRSVCATTRTLVMHCFGCDKKFVHGARLSAEIYIRGCCLGSHACSLEALASARLKLVHACDQWHSSRLCTPLTGWHCKFRPNTEGVM
jgi:hypothetical protein